MLKLSVSTKYGLAFAAGGLIGSLVTYYIVEKHYREFYMNFADEEIQSVKEEYKQYNQYNRLKTGYKSDYIDDYIGPDKDAEDKKFSVPSRVLTSSLDGYESKRESRGDVDYTKYFASDSVIDDYPREDDDYHEDPESENDITDEEKVRKEVESWDATHRKAVKEGSEPVLISELEYNNEYMNYDQEDLVYYAGNDVLIYAESDVSQELYEVVEDPKELLGELLDGGCFAGDPYMDIMFVRNDRLGIKYAVTKVEGRYEG